MEIFKNEVALGGTGMSHIWRTWLLSDHFPRAGHYTRRESKKIWGRCKNPSIYEGHVTNCQCWRDRKSASKPDVEMHFENKMVNSRVAVGREVISRQWQVHTVDCSSEASSVVWVRCGRHSWVLILEMGDKYPCSSFLMFGVEKILLV